MRKSASLIEYFLLATRLHLSQSKSRIHAGNLLTFCAEQELLGRRTMHSMDVEVGVNTSFVPGGDRGHVDFPHAKDAVAPTATTSVPPPFCIYGTLP